jgi:hypothetical protein
MKKILLTIVATMALTVSFAETKSSNNQNVENSYIGFDRVNFDKMNAERFDMSCDMNRLASVLDLNEWQMEAVEAIQNTFTNEMQSIATKRGPQRRHLVHEAVRKDAQQMQRVLNDKQFDTYMTLLGATLQNKHL